MGLTQTEAATAATPLYATSGILEHTRESIIDSLYAVAVLGAEQEVIDDVDDEDVCAAVMEATYVSVKALTWG